MSGRQLSRLTPSHKLLLAGVAAVTIGGPLTVGMLRAQAPKLGFDVASIKPSNAAGMRFGLQVLPGDRLKIDGAVLKSLIAYFGRLRHRRQGRPQPAGRRHATYARTRFHHMGTCAFAHAESAGRAVPTGGPDRQQGRARVRINAGQRRLKAASFADAGQRQYDAVAWKDRSAARHAGDACDDSW